MNGTSEVTRRPSLICTQVSPWSSLRKAPPLVPAYNVPLGEGRGGAAGAGGRDGVAWAEVANLATVSAAMVRGARARTETRGAHTREDFPDTDPNLRARFVQRG